MCVRECLQLLKIAGADEKLSKKIQEKLYGGRGGGEGMLHTLYVGGLKTHFTYLSDVWF